MPARVVLDRDAYHEKFACLLEDGVDMTIAMQWASVVGYNTPFSLVATAMLNGDAGPAKEMCRREQSVHGRAWAVELWKAIEDAVKEST